MISIFLLPFRGLVWFFLGAICSLPWLVIIGPATIHHWLPKALAYAFEKKTTFPCKIGSADVNLLEGKFSLKDVIIYNSKDFVSADFLKLNKVECSLSLSSLFQQTLHIQELDVNCENITSIQQQEQNNFQTLCEHFHNSQGKGLWVESFTFSMDGWVAMRNYGTERVKAMSAFNKHSFNFKNLCINVNESFKQNIFETCSLEQVYNNLNSLFLTSNR